MKYIYVMVGVPGLVKIGMSKHPERRAKELSVFTDVLTVFYKRQHADPAQIEALTHKILTPYHIRGELFAISPQTAEYAVDLAFEGYQRGERSYKNYEYIAQYRKKAYRPRRLLAGNTAVGNKQRTYKFRGH